MQSSREAATLHDTGKVKTYRGSLSLLATLVMLLTFLCVAFLERSTVEPVLRRLAAAPGQLSSANVVVLAQLLVVPVLCAVTAYIVAAQVIHLLRLTIYRRALHRHSGGWLHTYAPLWAAGIRLTGARYSATGKSARGREEPLDSLATGERSILLLGVEGAGKTETLHVLAYELTRRRALIPLYLRRLPLPILVHSATLTDDALDSQAGFIQHLQRQARLFGTKGLAARLPRMLRRGRVVLLCDGLDELAAPNRKRMGEIVARLLAALTGHTTIIMTCGLRTYEEEPRSLAPLETLDQVLADDVKTDTAIEALRRRPASSGTRRPQASELQSALDEYHLSAGVRSPATLAALMCIPVGTDGWPHGRGELYREYARALCATDDVATANRHALILGALAVSLRRASIRTLWIPASRSLGRVVVDWLDEALPLTPTELRSEPLLIASPEEAERACQLALTRGVLLRTADGAGLAFANTMLEAAFAAWWLDLMDDGLGRVNAELLQPQWTVPVVLWVGAQRAPADLASRLYRLIDTPESVAARAGLPAREAARVGTLALTLAAACEGLAGMLARVLATPAEAHQAFDVAQQHLRDLLDEAQRLIQDPDDEGRLGIALADVERRSGPEFVASILFLMRLPQLNRLARAQLVVLLGLIASPVAIDRLVELLDEPDAVLRQAVNQAVVLAGAACVEPLQAALRDPRERVRSRAEETLALLGDGAIDAALQGLASANAMQRASSARMLGTLRSVRATDALVRHLDDGESVVRVATARALGQIASAQALVALEQHSASPDAVLRAAVAQALGAGHDPESLPALLRLLGDTDGAVRAAAANALGVLGDERAVVPLQERRDDPDLWAQNAVVFALKRLGKG